MAGYYEDNFAKNNLGDRDNDEGRWWEVGEPSTPEVAPAAQDSIVALGRPLPVVEASGTRAALPIRTFNTQPSTQKVSIAKSAAQILQSRLPGADYSFYDSLPLSQHELAVRILTIAPGLTSDNLSCNLESTNLEDCSRYEALSYCWGPVDELRKVTVNEDALYITPNLWAALRSLRRREKPRRMWIDAMCINQDNNSERAAQVSIMRHIYTRARRTIAWLGVAADGSDTAFDLVKEQLLPCLHGIQETGDSKQSDKFVNKGFAAATDKKIHTMRVIFMRP